MRNMLAFMALMVLVVGGAGWYLDWFKVRSQPAQAPGQRSLSIDINTNKIGTDLHKGEQKLQEILDNKDKPSTTPADAKTSENKPQAGGDGKSLLPAVNVHIGDKGPTIQLQTGKAGR
jgi:hypothetical protein